MKSLQDLQCIPGFHIEIFMFVRIINKIITVVFNNLYPQLKKPQGRKGEPITIYSVSAVRGDEHEGP